MDAVVLRYLLPHSTIRMHSNGQQGCIIKVSVLSGRADVCKSINREGTAKDTDRWRERSKGISAFGFR